MTAPALSPREMQTLQMYAAGLGSKAVADTLFISTGTLKGISARLYAKLGVGSSEAGRAESNSIRAHAVARAYDLGLLSRGASEWSS